MNGLEDGVSEDERGDSCAIDAVQDGREGLLVPDSVPGSVYATRLHAHTRAMALGRRTGNGCRYAGNEREGRETCIPLMTPTGIYDATTPSGNGGGGDTTRTSTSTRINPITNETGGTSASTSRGTSRATSPVTTRGRASSGPTGLVLPSFSMSSTAIAPLSGTNG